MVTMYELLTFKDTSDITGYDFYTDEYNFVLIDTPGFNDKFRSDTDSLHDLAKWL
jgi:GTPase Era involved in 16S rRNA processing